MWQSFWTKDFKGPGLNPDLRQFFLLEYSFYLGKKTIGKNNNSFGNSLVFGRTKKIEA